MLGFYLSGNPLAEHEAILSRFVTHTNDEIKEGLDGQSVTVGGLVSAFRRTKIKMGPNAGRFMGRFVLEDLRGQIPVMLFASQLAQFGALVEDEAVLLVKGTVRARGSEAEISAEEVTPLARIQKQAVTAVDLLLGAETPQRRMLELRDLLAEYPGTVPVRILVKLDDRTVTVTPRDSFKIDLDQQLLSSVESLLGQGALRQRAQPFSPAPAASEPGSPDEVPWS